MITPEQEQKIREFEGKTIRHPHLTENLNFLKQITANPGGASLAMIVGPTGAGKTTLIDAFTRYYIGTLNNELVADPGFIPLVKVSAPASETHSFNWTDHYIRILEKLSEPNISLKVPPVIDVPIAPNRSERTVHGIRRLVERALKNRRTKVLIIDEAQHMCRTGSTQRYAEHLDCIKSFADQSGVFIVLIGTYDLLLFLDISEQLARRTRTSHFPRYRLNDEPQIDAFKQCLATFESAFPFSEPANLQCHWERIYQGSAGCIGILKNWLNAAVRHAAELGQATLTLKNLNETALLPSSLNKIAQEIAKHELKWQERQSCERDLQQALGFSVPSAHHKIIPRKNSSVGIPNAIRRPVGCV